ncbi:V-type ATP synthase subunit E family protein [Candidatus Bathyarchaeota archaeon]|nr:V-type ATP synthase subunit E family protein [Candidatus Bathyarchaeota archaeon]
MARARNEADTVRGMVISDARRKAGWVVLSEKERLIGNVLDEARARLVSMTNMKRYTLELEKTIVDAGTALGGGKLEVMLNERPTG